MLGVVFESLSLIYSCFTVILAKELAQVNINETATWATLRPRIGFVACADDGNSKLIQ